MKGKHPKNQKGNNGFSRRDFLRGAGVAVSGSVLATHGALAKPAPAPDTDILGPGEVPITLKINGAAHQLNVEPRVTLLDALRNQLDITGAKRVCDRGTCGACMVIMDGKSVYSCSQLAIECQGHAITTIESLSHDGHLNPIMNAFWDNDAQQCGFCTPGFLMSCKAFLDKHPNATLEQVNEGLSGNICRCGTYHGLKQAGVEAGKQVRKS